MFFDELRIMIGPDGAECEKPVHAVKHCKVTAPVFSVLFNIDFKKRVMGI